MHDSRETHVGLRSLTFFSTNLKGAKGSTAPEAFPTDTMVPFRRISLKLLSNLHTSPEKFRLATKTLPKQAINVRIFPDPVKHSMHTFPIRDL